MLLEKNGRASSSKRTKHINIRHFFITDRIAKGEVSIKWCPTGDMIGDYMTKPLQGASFRKFRDQIMGTVKAQDPGPGKAKPDEAKPNTHGASKPSKDKQTIKLVPPVKKSKGRNHRSVLDGGEKRVNKDGRKTANRGKTGVS